MCLFWVLVNLAVSATKVSLKPYTFHRRSKVCWDAVGQQRAQGNMTGLSHSLQGSCRKTFLIYHNIVKQMQIIAMLHSSQLLLILKLWGFKIVWKKNKTKKQQSEEQFLLREI